MRNQNQSSDSEARRKELAAIVQAGMAQLPEPERITLVLADMHELSYEEIARRTRVPIGTVRSRLSGARLRLRDYMLKNQDLLSAQYRYSARSSGEFRQPVVTPGSSR